MSTALSSAYCPPTRSPRVCRHQCRQCYGRYHFRPAWQPFARDRKSVTNGRARKELFGTEPVDYFHQVHVASASSSAWPYFANLQ
jgi:hypothetical protein